MMNRLRGREPQGIKEEGEKISECILQRWGVTLEVARSCWKTMRGRFMAEMNPSLLLPAKRNDARHIALATVADLDAIVSWNFRDMVNIRKKGIVHSVNARFGYRLIDIISPLEVPRE
jgi:hypothetical protein